MMELNARTFEDAINSDELVVVDFYAEWCGPCHYLSPVLEKLEKEFKGKVKFYKVNVDLNPELANYFGISSIPAVLMFKNKKVVNAFIGALPESTVRAEIERALRA